MASDKDKKNKAPKKAEVPPPDEVLEELGPEILETEPLEAEVSELGEHEETLLLDQEGPAHDKPGEKFISFDDAKADDDGIIDLFSAPEQPATPAPEAGDAEHAPLRNPTTLRPMAPHTTLASAEPPPQLPPDNGSGVDLLELSEEAKEVVVPELAGSLGEASVSGDSGIDLVEEQLLAEGDALSGIVHAGHDKTDSGRDLIAEAVESGVDLDVPHPELAADAVPTPSTEVEEGAMFEGARAEIPSSTVDLGGPLKRPKTEHAEEPLPLSSGVLAEAASGSFDAAINLEDLPVPAPPPGTAASEVDLGGRAVESRIHAAESSLRESGEVVSDSDEQFSGIGDNSHIASTVHANPDSMVRVTNEPEPEQELDIGEAFDEEEIVSEVEDEEQPPKKAKERDDQLVPAGPSKGRGGAWVGGTLLGTLLGAGACVGLAFVDVNLPDMAKGALTSQTGTKKTGPAPAQAPTPSPVAGLSPEELLKDGEFGKAAQAGIDKVDEAKPETFALRGEHRWLSYLQKQAAAKAPLKKDDEDVKQAVEDLTKAGTADAAFWLGHVQEITGDLPAARQTYNAAAAKYKDDTVQAGRVQAALDRLDVRAEKLAPGARSDAVPWNAREALVVALLLTNLQADNVKDDEKAKKDDKPKSDDTPKKDDDKPKKDDKPKSDDTPKRDDDKPKKDDDKPKKDDKPKDDEKAKKKDERPRDDQSKEDKPPQPIKADEEAGAEFWAAANTAHEQQYAKALQALARARAIHDQRRFSRLKKAQNPLSDPTEEIFLHACDELKTAWELKDRLQKGGYLAENKDPVKAVEDLVAKVKEGGESKAIAEKLIAEKLIEKPEELADGVNQLLKTRKAVLDLGEKLVKEKAAEKPEDLDKAVTDLLANKKATDALADKLVKAKIIEKIEDFGKGVAALLTTKQSGDELAEKLVKEKVVEEPDLAKGVDMLLADRKAAAAKVADLTQALAAANTTFKQLGDDLVAAKLYDGKGSLVDSVKSAIKLAAVADPQGQIRTLQGQLTKARAALGTARTPRDMLEVWLPQMKVGADVAAAGTDADRVLADPDATADLKARAAALQALTEWSQSKFAEARPALERALAALPAGASPWRTKVEQALRDATDPVRYFRDKARAAEAQGNLAAAIAALNAASGGGKEKANVLVDRARLQLEQARARNDGRLAADDPGLTSVRKDLAAAAHEGNPRAHYLLGQVAEELGQWKQAEAAYRAAVKAYPRVTGDGSTYRAALARVLLRDRQARPAPKAAPKETPKEEGAKEEKSTGMLQPTGGLDALQTLVLLTTLGFQFQPQAPDPARAEAEKLADEILAEPADKVPFEARARALAIKGLWSRALQTYVNGLQPYLKREHAAGLLDLVQRHPSLRRPEKLDAPNGFEAERYYANGLRHYFAREYAAAEADFGSAVEEDNNDARFFYFLGLARLAQNKRDAIEDFEQGAKLELQDRPGRTAVSQALERVQGRARKAVNQVRDAAR